LSILPEATGDYRRIIEADVKEKEIKILVFGSASISLQLLV
jgi:hypothetical protein